MKKAALGLGLSTLLVVCTRENIPAEGVLFIKYYCQLAASFSYFLFACVQLFFFEMMLGQENYVKLVVLHKFWHFTKCPPKHFTPFVSRSWECINF